MIQKGGVEMRRYTRPHRISVSASVAPSSVANQTISDRVRRILSDNSPLLSEDWFLLTQVHLICLFRRARTESRKRKITKYLSRREEKYISQKKDPKSGLTPQDFIGLNQWVVNQDLVHKLESLIKRVKQRKREAKRAKKIKDHHLLTSGPIV